MKPKSVICTIIAAYYFNVVTAVGNSSDLNVVLVYLYFLRCVILLHPENSSYTSHATHRTKNINCACVCNKSNRRSDAHQI